MPGQNTAVPQFPRTQRGRRSPVGSGTSPDPFTRLLSSSYSSSGGPYVPRGQRKVPGSHPPKPQPSPSPQNNLPTNGTKKNPPHFGRSAQSPHLDPERGP